MSYTLVPNSGQTLGQTRNPIRTNFQIIRDRFQQNHEQYNGGTGKHTIIQLPEQGTSPLTPANEGWAQAEDFNARTELMWRPENTGAAGDKWALTGIPIRAAGRFDGTGAAGIKALIGQSFNVTSVTADGAGNYTVLFATQFPLGAPAANYFPMVIACSTAGANLSAGVKTLLAASFIINVPGGVLSGNYVSFVVYGG